MTQIASAPPQATVASPPAQQVAPPTAAAQRAAARRHYFTGTPGRMRINAVIAAVMCLAFAAVGFFGLRALDGAVDRAGANTEQVIRVQQIYADLLTADAATTNGFLQGGLEPAQLRASYDKSIAAVSSNIAAAAKAQPADGVALAALNTKLESYTSYIDQARSYNRQTLPVGAQYQTLASQQLRAEILPIVAELAKANQQRADQELGAGLAGIIPIVVGVLTLIVLAAIALWLAKKTHRYLNLPLTGAILLVLAATALLLTSVASATTTMGRVAEGDFKSAVALASGRAAAYDMKSNESLTLIARGSGRGYEDAYGEARDTALEQLNGAGYGAGKSPDLVASVNKYNGVHTRIRSLDNGGDWDAAVELATQAGAGGANATFEEFDTRATAELDKRVKGALSALDGLRTPLFPWLVGLAGVLAALAAGRSMTKRIEEYR